MPSTAAFDVLIRDGQTCQECGEPTGIITVLYWIDPDGGLRSTELAGCTGHLMPVRVDR